jgi:hypothetical protein
LTYIKSSYYSVVVTAAPPPRFCLLIHQLPPRPLYLRAKIRTRLERAGALPIKNSVYVLPDREDCREDLLWIAQEADAGGGEAFVCTAEFVAGLSSDALVRRFREAADRAYGELAAEVRAAIARLRAGGSRDDRAHLVRLRRKREAIRERDFFDSLLGKETLAMLTAYETRLTKGRARAAVRSPIAPELRGRVWVTRHGPKVDRLASAWLVRRFVDPRARFRFIDPPTERVRPREIGFDMPGGQFSHEGERCTFETLLARLGLRDPALQALAEVVHDLDLKDAKFARPETEGVGRLLIGLLTAHPRDAERLERGLVFFDELYASYRQDGRALGPSESGPGSARGRKAEGRRVSKSARRRTAKGRRTGP